MTTKLSNAQIQLVTVLYGDWSEFVQSPENGDRLEDFQRELDQHISTISAAGGSLKLRQPFSFMVFWSTEEALENEAENAVRFALKLRDFSQAFMSTNVLPLKLVLATGEVQFLPAGDASKSEVVYKGDAIDLCRRVPALIPDGGVAIGEDTLRRVEGIFSIRPLAQIPVLGKSEPVAIYRVLFEKAIQFRIVQHGVEGSTTRLIGRELEVKQFRDAYEITSDERENHLITVIGEAGTGKSRLLLEVERWRDLIADSTRLFRAQASPDMLQQPYSLLRRILMVRFGVQDGDPDLEAFEKTLKGVESFMGAGNLEAAQRLAQLVGLPCPECPQPEDSGSVALFEQRALESLSAFFRAVDAATGKGVISLHLEDMHWADDKSLDALLWLMRKNTRNRLIMVVLARPELLDRRPRWGLDQTNSIRMDLHTLTARDARKLVREVLQKVEELPDSLLDWIVERSGGNPLYIEELVRSLIATGVVQKVEDGQLWQVDLSRLDEVRIPDTLTGLLQIQLANLPVMQRVALQRASVIGRSFWDAALTALDTADDYTVQLMPTLTGLTRRNLIFRQERSSFAGMQEYAFVNNLLYSEAYHSIPEANRRSYHRLAAEWLQKTSGETPAMAARIADHFDRAGEGTRAVRYLALAAEEAHRLNAFGQMRQFLRRAVNFAEESPSFPETPDRATLLYRLGEMMILIGEASQAIPYLQEGLSVARKLQNKGVMAEALGRLGWAAYYSGDFPQASKWLEEGIVCARESENQPALLLCLRQLGNVVSANNDYILARELYKESLQLARGLGDQSGVTSALNNLGLAGILTGEYAQAHQYLEETIQLAEQRGDRMSVALALGNLGIADHFAGDNERALDDLKRAIDLSRSIGSQLVVAESSIWSGICLTSMGDLSSAETQLREGLRVSVKTEQTTLALGALVGFANLAAQQGDPEQAVKLLALTMENPAVDDLIRGLVATPLLDKLHAELSPQAFGLAWAHGLSLKPDEVMQSYQ